VTSFDYLHSARPEFFDKLFDTRIPQTLRIPAFVLAATVLASAGTCAAEEARLRCVRQAEIRYRLSYAESERELRTLNVYYDRVKSVVLLDRRVRTIVASGSRAGESLAHVAGILPRRAWLTSLDAGTSGISIEGAAPDFAEVSALLSRTGPATLLHAARADDAPGSIVSFSVRIGSAP
jgi:hypothetical protein